MGSTRIFLTVILIFSVLLVGVPTQSAWAHSDGNHEHSGDKIKLGAVCVFGVAALALGGMMIYKYFIKKEPPETQQTHYFIEPRAGASSRFDPMSVEWKF